MDLEHQKAPCLLRQFGGVLLVVGTLRPVELVGANKLDGRHPFAADDLRVGLASPSERLIGKAAVALCRCIRSRFR